MTAPTPRRRLRWYQFSLRTLFVVTTLLAIPLGWFGWQVRTVRERKELLATVQSAGGGFDMSGLTKAEIDAGGADDPFAEPPPSRIDRPGTKSKTRRSADWPSVYGVGLPALEPDVSGDLGKEPQKFRRWLGDRIVLAIWIPTSIPSAETERIIQCFPEADVWMVEPIQDH